MRSIFPKSKLVQIITKYRYGSKIIVDYHHHDGAFSNYTYHKSYLDDIPYYEKYKEQIGFNIENLKFWQVQSFFESLFKNIIHFIVMFIYIQFRLLIIAIEKFLQQYNHVKKNLAEYRIQTVDMRFKSWLHFYLAVVWTPIRFYIELLFIEHGERVLDAVTTLIGHLLSTFVTILLQLFLILLIPLVLLLIVLFYLVVGLFWLINKLFIAIFKPIEIKGNV